MKFFTALLVTLLCNQIYAQNRPGRYMTVELAGNAKHISVNYDSRFNPKKTGGLGFRIGLGGTRYYYANGISLSIPAGLNYLIGANRHFAELGIVAIPENLFKGSKSYFNFGTNANLGYRYTGQRGFMLSVLWTPQLTRSNQSITFVPKRVLQFGIGAGIRL